MGRMVPRRSSPITDRKSEAFLTISLMESVLASAIIMFLMEEVVTNHTSIFRMVLTKIRVGGRKYSRYLKLL